MLASKLLFILDDLLWVLTDSQLKAIIHYAKSLSEAMEKSAQQRKSMTAESLQVSLLAHKLICHFALMYYSWSMGLMRFIYSTFRSTCSKYACLCCFKGYVFFRVSDVVFNSQGILPTRDPPFSVNRVFAGGFLWWGSLL